MITYMIELVDAGEYKIPCESIYGLLAQVISIRVQELSRYSKID
jgi:hypothetical protein